MTRGPGNGAPTPARLDALTGIRGIAAWFVVFYHVRHSLETIVPEAVLAVFAKGYLAVDLFFVLSGFVLWFNYGERLREGGRPQTGLFLWRRFARVWPLHAFMLAIFVLLALLIVATGRYNDSYPFAELPLHILLIHNWGFTSGLTWNDPSWSISTEFAAYLLFPLIVVALPWQRFGTSALIGVGAVLTAAIALLFALNGESLLDGNIPKLGVWRCLGEFCLGIVACLLWQKLRDRDPASAVLAGISLAIAVLGFALGVPETHFLPAAFCIAIVALAADRSLVARVLSSRPGVYLGEISYSTYLSHFFLFIAFKLLFLEDSLQLGWGGLAGYVAMVASASVALYHGVEKPAQAWLNRRRPPWASGRPAGAME